MLVLAFAFLSCGPARLAPMPASEPPAVVQEPPAPPLTEPPAAEEVPAGVATVTLGAAVALALERNYGLLNAADSVATGRLREGVSRAEFHPRLTPRFEGSADNALLGLEASQRLPWTGGSLAASASFRSQAEELGPYPRSSDVRLEVRQPLLRGFGPNAAYFDLRNSRRARQARERDYELGRQRLAVDVARSFYQVLQQRQLLAVARQSLRRSESLQKASEARLEVGLVSKLDVYRAQLQASQAQDAMVRADASLQTELERFRTLLGLDPGEALQPAPAALPEDVSDTVASVEVLTAKALAHRVDLQETRDGVEDARRSASLARQNLLPQLDLKLAMSGVGLGTTFGSSLSTADHRLSLSLTTSYPLERSSEAADKATAELAVISRERSMRQRELDVAAEVRAGVRELERIRKSVELQKKAVEIAEQQRRLATLRYQRGLASNFDVVDAESSLVLARSALVGLLASYQVARVDLMRITGTLDVTGDFAP